MLDIWQINKASILRRVILLLLFVYSFSLPQDIQHEAIAINIEVPVRVFKGDTFIDNLKINDFELYEEGVLQNIEAVYLINKNEISREEIGEDKDTNSFAPQISRLFVLIFELRNYIASVTSIINCRIKA